MDLVMLMEYLKDKLSDRIAVFDTADHEPGGLNHWSCCLRGSKQHGLSLGFVLVMVIGFLREKGIDHDSEMRVYTRDNGDHVIPLPPENGRLIVGQPGINLVCIRKEE